MIDVTRSLDGGVCEFDKLHVLGSGPVPAPRARPRSRNRKLEFRLAESLHELTSKDGIR